MNLQITNSTQSKNIVLFLSFFLLFSCEQKNNTQVKNKVAVKSSKNIEIEALKTLISEKFDSNTQAPFIVFPNDTVNQLEIYKEIYKEKEPLWLVEEGINTSAQELILSLKDLENDGIDIARYKISDLENLMSEIKSNSTNEKAFEFEINMTDVFLKATNDMLLGATINKNKEIKNPNDSLIHKAEILKMALQNEDIQKAFIQMRPAHPWYKKFREEYIRLSAQKMQNSNLQISNIQDSLKMGDSSIAIQNIRKKLYKEVSQPIDTISQKWENDVVDALKKYQFSNQLKVSGILDSNTIKKLNSNVESKLKILALNMERMRWLKHEFKQPYVWVAIPKMEMDYMDKDSIQFNMRVVVGRPARATPALDTKIQNIVLSPPWGVPPTIMREEVVPGIARRGGSYLARRGLKAYDSRGRVVNASAINASNYKRFSIQQAPGYSSSLGEVKFNMPNPWAIYMHDTPHREDFVKSYRAFSSGCVRVHKPKEFATFLLQDTINYSYAKIDSICKLRKTISVPIHRNIDVHFVYLTNALDSAGNIMYLKDIYKWDKI